MVVTILNGEVTILIMILIDILICTIVFLLVVALILNIIESYKRRRLRRSKVICFSNLSELVRKLSTFVSEATDQEEWIKNLSALSGVKLTGVEQATLTEYIEAYNDYLVLHKLKKASEVAILQVHKKLYLSLLWEVYLLLKHLPSSEWMVKVQSIINVNHSNENIVRLQSNGSISIMVLINLMKEATTLIQQLKEQNKNDYKLVDQFNCILTKIERASNQFSSSSFKGQFSKT